MKKRRSAAQRAATARMLAARRAQLAGKRRTKRALRSNYVTRTGKVRSYSASRRRRRSGNGGSLAVSYPHLRIHVQRSSGGPFQSVAAFNNPARAKQYARRVHRALGGTVRVVRV